MRFKKGMNEHWVSFYDVLVVLTGSCDLFQSGCELELHEAVNIWAFFSPTRMAISYGLSNNIMTFSFQKVYVLFERQNDTEKEKDRKGWGRERKREWQREEKIFHLLVHSSHQEGLGQAETSSQEPHHRSAVWVTSFSHTGNRDSSAWATIFCPPRYISRMSDRKLCSWAWNWALWDGM